MFGALLPVWKQGFSKMWGLLALTQFRERETECSILFAVGERLEMKGFLEMV
jgi:hypothetical protein